MAPPLGETGVLLGLGCAVVAWLAAHFALLQNLEEWLQDGCFTFRGQRSSRARILIVGLDERSFDGLKKPLLYTSPEFAEVVRAGRQRMPGFAAALKLEQEADILAWIRSLKFQMAAP